MNIIVKMPSKLPDAVQCAPLACVSDRDVKRFEFATCAIDETGRLTGDCLIAGDAARE